MWRRSETQTALFTDLFQPLLCHHRAYIHMCGVHRDLQTVYAVQVFVSQ